MPKQSWNRVPKVTALFALFVFVFSCLSPTVSAAEVLLRCDSLGRCKTPKPGLEKSSTHLGFTILKANQLLKIKQSHDLLLPKVELLKARIKNKDSVIKWREKQLESSNKAAEKTARANANLQSENKSLQAQNQKQTLQIASLETKAARNLLIGAGVGAGAVVVIAVGVGIFVALK